MNTNHSLQYGWWKVKVTHLTLWMLQPWSKAHHRPHLISFSLERGTFKKQIRSGLSPADSMLMTSHCIQDNVRIPLCSSQGFTTQVLAALNLIPLATWHLDQQSRYVLPAKLCQRGLSWVSTGWTYTQSSSSSGFIPVLMLLKPALTSHPSSWHLSHFTIYLIA